MALTETFAAENRISSSLEYYSLSADTFEQKQTKRDAEQAHGRKRADVSAGQNARSGA
mgnify:CR=1 FL=1